MKPLFASLFMLCSFIISSCDTGLTAYIDSAPASGNRKNGTAGDYRGNWSSLFDIPKQDSKGWSVLEPSADSRLIFVSNDGNDNTARFYSPSDREIGKSSFFPDGEIHSYETIDAALKQMRDNYPDYLLLKRGDIWIHDAESIRLPSGRSSSERAVLAYYGREAARPIVETGNGDGVDLTYANYSALMGIKFIADGRNPGSDSFVGFNNVSDAKGFQAVSYGTLSGYVLIEDCWFDWYAENTISNNSVDSSGRVIDPLTNVIIRRSIITNNYSSESRSQGLYSAYSSLLLEENTFDHNGWYQQGDSLTKADGKAAMFNHNTYFSETRNTILRKNLFLRPSSTGTQFTSGTTSGKNKIKAWNILVDNNLYIDGEAGISFDGNKDQRNGPRWENIYVTNNVLMHLGRSEPANRGLGGGLVIEDWKKGSVVGNIFTSWGNKYLTNTWAIKSDGYATDVEYNGNIVYHIVSSQPLVQIQGEGIQAGVTFFNNAIQTEEYEDPDRTIETYLSSRGYSSNMKSFTALLTAQSKYNWNPVLTAEKINDYVRKGFASR